MTATAAIIAGRRAALSLMGDKCKISRVIGLASGADGWQTHTESVVWEGPCRVQTYEPYEATITAGGHTSVVQRYQIHLPVDTPPLQEGDLVTVDGYQRVFRVAGLLQKTFQTAQRLLVDEVIS